MNNTLDTLCDFSGATVFKRIQSALRMIPNYLFQVNLFKKRYNDQYGRYTEVLTTRFYLLLLGGFLLILSFYTSVIEHVRTIEVNNPSINTYHQLANSEFDTLSCPCTQTIATYNTFITSAPVSSKNRQVLGVEFEAIGDIQSVSLIASNG